MAERKKIEIVIPKEEIKKKKPRFLIIAGIICIVGAAILAKFNIDLNFKIADLENQDTTELIIESAPTLELSENQELKAEIETEDGVIEAYSMPVVEEVDGGIIDDDFDPDVDGRGETFDISTPQKFRDSVLGKCVIMANKFGAQCVSLARAFWLSYTNRSFSTCNTGMAKGAWNCKEDNAGKEFELITDRKKLQAGDWVIFTGGEFGHVGMALGGYNKGYISLLGENQGGTSCAGGGAAANIINISLQNFVGAFRPKIYSLPKVPDTSFAK